MKATILICTCNRAEHLRQTLESLANICVPEDLPTEILIIDNASTDETSVVAAAFQPDNMASRYLYVATPGKCLALNSGMSESRGEILLFTDDDVRFPQDWLQKMCAPILSGKALAVAGSIKMAPHLVRPWMRQLHRDWLLEYDFSKTEFPHVMIGANMALSRKVLESVPVYDEELGPGKLGFSDDVLFSWQVEQAGFPIMTAGDSAVEHHFDESRLLRASLLDRARREGQVEAYLAYHWLHSEMKLPRLRLLRHALKKAYFQMRRGGECKSAEGAPEWELQLIKDISFQDYFMRQQKRPRNYEKRGLVKLPDR